MDTNNIDINSISNQILHKLDNGTNAVQFIKDNFNNNNQIFLFRKNSNTTDPIRITTKNKNNEIYHYILEKSKDLNNLFRNNIRDYKMIINNNQ